MIKAIGLAGFSINRDCDGVMGWSELGCEKRKYGVRTSS